MKLQTNKERAGAGAGKEQKMTKEKLIRIQTARGYKVEDLGKVVIFEMEDEKSLYRAIWFFNTDGTQDENNPMQWKLTKK